MECLVNEARSAGVRRFTRRGAKNVRRRADGFELQLANDRTTLCDRLLLATGGTRSNSGAEIAQSLGHTLLQAVPSLFSFHIAEPWLRKLPGVSVPEVEASVAGTRLRERGPVLVTHHGL